MELRYPIITINREFGAKGHQVGKALAEALELPWYDNDFIRITAEASGYSEEDVKREGEELGQGGRILDKILNSSVSYTSSHDEIFEAQKHVMLRLAEKPCIIIGRCANVILKDAGKDVFRIFLYADMDKRVATTLENNDLGDMDPVKYVEKRDHLRNIYHKTYTYRELGDYHDYDLMLNTGLMSVEACVELIKACVLK